MRRAEPVRGSARFIVRVAFLVGLLGCTPPPEKGEGVPSLDRPPVMAVEDLLEQVEGWPPDARTAELWIPEILTFEGEPIPRNLGVAIVNSKTISRHFYPEGSTELEGGRLTRYRWAENAGALLAE